MNQCEQKEASEVAQDEAGPTTQNEENPTATPQGEVMFRILSLSMLGID